MADYGHDPTETAVPWSKFQDAGFKIAFATERGKPPACDDRMLTGWTQKLLGADRQTISLYERMIKSTELQEPLSWSSADFSLLAFDVVFLPGGHEKSVRQQIDSPILHSQLSAFWAQTTKPSRKHVAAICHGVLAVSEALHQVDGQERSLLWEVKSTALPGALENIAYHGTRLFLGDYYKTYGKGSDNVETVVKSRMKNSDLQWQSRLDGTPFVVLDDKRNYYSGRFPPDAELLARTVIENVRNQVQDTANTASTQSEG